jgi:hypothetical protein
VAGALTVNRKVITLSATKTYDGNTDLTGVVSIDTGIHGETLTYIGAAANDANVLTDSKFISAITLANGTGGVASNYALPVLNANNAPVTITPKTVSLAAERLYDGTTDLTGAVTVTTGVAGQQLNYSGAAANDANVMMADKFISTITLVDSNTALASN